MSDTFRFWTHGVNVQIEHTSPNLGLVVRRAGWGTSIRQAGGTWNWFHFAIPSPTKLDDDWVDHYHAYLRGRINNHAVMNLVHIREASGRANVPVIYSSAMNITGRDLEESYNIDDRRARGPLVMAIRVQFDDEGGGEVVFTGAGAWFEER